MPKVMKMAKRCILNQPFQQWCIAFAASVDFAYPPKQLVEMIRAFCTSWLQSRINEQGNKVLRDGEAKDNSSKVSGGRLRVKHSIRTAW